MLKEAWKVAIETLSWIDMQKLSEQMAFAKTIKQIRAKNTNSIRLAYSLFIETIRRKNQIDKFINHVLNP